MKHAMMETAAGPKVVRADGTEPRPFDADRPVLHLLPQLLVPKGMSLRPNRMTCHVEASGHPIPQLVVRQPMPNRRYCVAGTADTRYGFMIPLAGGGPSEMPITITWTLPWDDVGEIFGQAMVRHDILLRLVPTDRGQVYSMDVMSHSWWRRHETPPMHRQPWSTFDPDVLPNGRRPAWRGIDGAAFVMREELEVPAGLLSDIWGVQEFEDEQLHEVAQAAGFDPASPDTAAHRANACIEMPAEVLATAIRLAGSIPFDEGSAFSGCMGACETHPATRHLTDWWNAHAPVPAHRCAGFAMPWVRVCDDGQYWCGYFETPNMAVDHTIKRPAMAARIGDVVLVEFVKGQAEATFNESGMDIYDVCGGTWSSVGVSERDVTSGKYDEAWYALTALAQFPGRFPAAWAWLNGVEIDAAAAD